MSWNHDAEYPAFREDARHLCRRLVKIGPAGVSCVNDRTYKIERNTLAAASALGLRPGDWVGLNLNSKRQVIGIELLAPCRTEFRGPEIDRETIREWNLFLKTVRDFFGKEAFLEVQTPTLVNCPGTEPFLDVFETEFRQGRTRRRYFLPTSPELHLKKLVAAGYGPLFEIRTCFRNGEVSRLHQPEFWMLEWYRPGQDLEAIRQDCRRLITACAKALKKNAPKTTTRFSMRDLFKRHANLDLRPDSTAQELTEKSRELGLSMPANSDFDDAFYYLFLEKVEPKIPQRSLVFVEKYPPSQAALARLTADGWGDRFELYWRGMEIANAYHELNDPTVQRARSREDLRKREQRKAQTLQLDEDFFQALEAGMPPTAGIALGLERLFLALTGRHSLNEIRLFTLKN